MKAACSQTRKQIASRRAIVFACSIALSTLAHGGIFFGIMKVPSSPRVASTSLIAVELFETKTSHGSSSHPARAKNKMKTEDPLPANTVTLPNQPSSHISAEALPAAETQHTASNGHGALHGGRDSIDSRARGYLDGILSEIKNRRIYPTESKRRGEEGLVEVGLTITKDGHIENVEIHRSSSFARLDEAALKAVRELPPQSPIPDEWSKNSISVIVPFEYRLR